MTQIIIFLISSTSAPKNNSKRRALFSECGGMRGCSGTDEAGKKKTVYSLQKTRLHHWHEHRSHLRTKENKLLLLIRLEKVTKSSLKSLDTTNPQLD